MLLAILVRGLKGERGSVVCLWALMVIGDWCEGEAEVVKPPKSAISIQKIQKIPQILFAQIKQNLKLEMKAYVVLKLEVKSVVKIQPIW